MIILGHLGAMLKRYDATLVYHCFVKRIDELKSVSVVPMLKYIEQYNLDYIEEINIYKSWDKSEYVRLSRNPFWDGELYNGNVKSHFKLGFGEYYLFTIELLVYYIEDLYFLLNSSI